MMRRTFRHLAKRSASSSSSLMTCGGACGVRGGLALRPTARLLAAATRVPAGTVDAQCANARMMDARNAQTLTEEGPTGGASAAAKTHIPGVSPEELAERIKKYSEAQAHNETSRAQKMSALQVDYMRRALPPNQFQEFLQNLGKDEARNAKEQAKMDKMSPIELYRYQNKKRKRENRLQNLNLLWHVFMGVASLYMMFCWFWF